jgi:uncharacterized membrane protein
VGRIRNIIALLRGQLWIIPALITIFAGVLAYVLLMYGGNFLNGNEITAWWLYNGQAATARDLLASLLSGLMTMTSLVVSVTFVILTLAANQLGPRLISIFMADRQIQSVIGLFLGTILYVILVLRTLDDTLGSEGVPHVAVTVASFLTIACLFALLFYIHKIARLIIADNVVEIVGKSLRHNLREILSEGEQQEAAPIDFGSSPSTRISLNCAGYIQVIDYGRLAHIARETNSAFEVRVRAGHFVLAIGDHVVVHADRILDDKVADEVRKAFTIASERTPAQDLEHGIRQLVEIAVRALSPGINDLFTATAVIDRLGAAFEEIFLCSLQPKVLRDKAGVPRVVASRSDETGLVDAAFDGIRQAGAGHPMVLIRMADILGQLGPVLRTEGARRAVLAQLNKLAETAHHAHLPPTDKEDTLRRIAQAESVIMGR